MGTDGRHLFSSNSFNLPIQTSFIIPKHKFLGWKDFNLDGDWVLKLSGEPDGDHRFLQISSRRWRYITRLIDGPYPDWRQAVPHARDIRTTLTMAPDKLEALIQLIERAPDGDPVHHRIGIGCEDTEKPCLLCKATEAAPWTRIPMPGGGFQGKPVTVFLDRQYFIKALKFGLSNIDLIDELSPLRFHLGGRQMIVMPVLLTAPGSQDHKPPVPSSRETPEPPASLKIHRVESPEDKPPTIQERKSQPMPDTELTPSPPPPQQHAPWTASADH